MSRSVIPLAMLIANTNAGPRGSEIAGWLSGVVLEREDYKLDVIPLAPARYRPPSSATSRRRHARRARSCPPDWTRRRRS